MWQTNRYFLREGDSMNYMIKGIQALKESFFLGIIIYIVIFVLLYLFKKRRTISWNMRKKDKSPKSSCFHCYTMFDPCTLFDWNLCSGGQ